MRTDKYFRYHFINIVISSTLFFPPIRNIKIQRNVSGFGFFWSKFPYFLSQSMSNVFINISFTIERVSANLAIRQIFRPAICMVTITNITQKNSTVLNLNSVQLFLWYFLYFEHFLKVSFTLWISIVESFFMHD